MRTPRILRLSWPAALLVVAMTPAAHAQGTARSMDLDPSVRAAGMGAASNAVFWDQVTNHWVNPAHLGYQRGLGYEWGNTKLLPSLSEDIQFSTNVLKLGSGGLGLAFSGQPFGLGGRHLSYGESEGTDPSGNPTGSFESFEQIDAWSIGVSVVRAAEAIAAMTGRDPGAWSRWGDVSFGMTGKHWEIELAPVDGHAETDAHDLGLLVRLSPTEFFPGLREYVGLDLSYGWSDLSYDGDPVHFINETDPSEISEHERVGYAGRVRFDWPDLASQMGGPEWIWQSLSPLLSFGLADDHTESGPSAFPYETDGNGWELTIANVFSLRRGHYEDRLGDIDVDTEGWGVGLPLGPFGGVRYDFARFPQPAFSGLPDLERHAASGWVDVMRVWRRMRS